MKNNRKLIKTIAGVSIFSALAIILYMVPFLQFPIIPGIPFLKLHFDELPVLIGSLLYGPFGGIAILTIKSLFKLIQDLGETFGIGVFADFLYGLALILPASLIYKKKHTFNGAMIGITVGFTVSLITSSFIGYYTIYPLYGLAFFPEESSSYNEALSVIGNTFFLQVDPSISSPFSIRICLEFLLPFNLIKLVIVTILTIICYKPLSKLRHKNEE